jgi:hypothetical protein
MLDLPQAPSRFPHEKLAMEAQLGRLLRKEQIENKSSLILAVKLDPQASFGAPTA